MPWIKIKRDWNKEAAFKFLRTLLFWLVKGRHKNYSWIMTLVSSTGSEKHFCFWIARRNWACYSFWFLTIWRHSFSSSNGKSERQRISNKTQFFSFSSLFFFLELKFLGFAQSCSILLENKRQCSGSCRMSPPSLVFFTQVG